MHVLFFFDLNKESRSYVQAMVNEENYFLYNNLKREAMPQGRPVPNVPNWAPRLRCLLSAVQVHTTTHCT